MTDYIAAFFEILGNKDKKLAQALKYRLSLEGNFMCLLSYEISNDGNNLEKIINNCDKEAVKDLGTSSDNYCTAGIFALLKGETERGKAYLNMAIQNLSIESAKDLLLYPKSKNDDEVLEYLNESRKGEYKSILEKANHLKETIKKVYKEFSSMYDAKKVLREIETARKVRLESLNKETKKPKKSLN